MICLLPCAILIAGPAAAWDINGTLVSGANGVQSRLLCAPDGAGGFIVAWLSIEPESHTLYAQHMNAAGEALWASGGIRVADDDFIPNFRLAADGQGGVFATWQAWNWPRNPLGPGDGSLFLQHLSATGERLWSAQLVSDSCNAGCGLSLNADGAGGVLLAWVEGENNDNPLTPLTVRAQHFDASGQRLWSPGGATVAPVGIFQTAPDIVPITGGAAVTFHRHVPALYGPGDLALNVQKLDEQGVRRWGDEGMLVLARINYGCEASVSDGAGGVIVAWDVSGEFRAQRFSAEGAGLWGSTGSLVGQGGYSAITSIVEDGSGGVMLGWDHSLGTGQDQPNVLAQWIDGDGRTHWGSGPLLVSDPTTWRGELQLSPDGAGGAFGVWREGDISMPRILGQRYGNDGTPQWSSAVEITSAATGYQEGGAALLHDPAGGVFVAYTDWHDGASDLYAQHISAAGELGLRAQGIEFDATVDRARIRWHLPQAAGLTGCVQWRSPGHAWTDLCAASTDAAGWLETLDRTVQPGTSRDYRLALMRGAVRAVGAEVTVSIPTHTTLALSTARWNTARRSLSVEFVLGESGAVRLEAFDLSGRRVLARDLSALLPGAHTLEWGDAQALASGRYVIRLIQGHEMRSRTVTIVR
jgi:hypothetical protein